MHRPSRKCGRRLTRTFLGIDFFSIPLLDNGAVIGCMAYIDRNPLRAKMANNPAEAVFTSIAHRLSAAGTGQQPLYFCAEDCRSGAHLTSLADCRPLDPLTGVHQRAGLTLAEYASIIARGKPTSGAIQVCAHLGIDSQAWSEAQREGGRFQGSLLGGVPLARPLRRHQARKSLPTKTACGPNISKGCVSTF